MGYEETIMVYQYLALICVAIISLLIGIVLSFFYFLPWLLRKPPFWMGYVKETSIDNLQMIQAEVSLELSLREPRKE